MFRVSDILIHAISILALGVLAGILIGAVCCVWDWAFTKILEVLGLKKEFVQFIINKYRAKKVVAKPKME